MITIRCITGLGDIAIELYEEQAPRTVAHFLAYIDEGYFDGASFYRTVRLDNQPPDAVRIEVIEAGYSNAYYDAALRQGSKHKQAFDESLGPRGPHQRIRVETTQETGLRHRNGTISLGRYGPDTVDDSFFICLNDQPELDYGGRRCLDGLGFSACGQVIEGMDVVRAIHNQPATGQLIDSQVAIISLRREA